jgi:phytoene synthase
MTDAGDHEGDDPDAMIRRVDPDRWLSSRFIADLQTRADVVALYAYDHELARAPRTASNPLVGEMRLVWWREVLDEIFESRPVRRHPTALALAEMVRRRGLAREPLEAMIDGRYRELDPQPMDAAEALSWAGDTAGTAAVLAAMLLDPGAFAESARSAGAAWALTHALAAGRLEVEPGGVALEQALRAARADVRGLSVRAFPAAAHATLARGRTKPAGSDLAKRLRLTLAVARGRI